MALSFDGSTENLRLTTLPITGYPFSIAGWFATAAVTQSAQVLCALTDDSGFNDYQQLIFVGAASANSRTLEAQSRTNSPGVLTSSVRSASGVANGVWHHAAGVWASDSSRTVYLDGAAGTHNTTTCGFASAIDILSIGNNDRSGAGWQFFNGGLAEMGVWNVALTAAEVLILSKGYSPLFVRPESLVMYAALVRSRLDVISGITLTDVNTPDVVAHPPIRYPARLHVGRTPPSAGGTSLAPSALAIPSSVPSPAITHGHLRDPDPAVVASQVPAPGVSLRITPTFNSSPKITSAVPAPAITFGSRLAPDALEIPTALPAPTVDAAGAISAEPVEVPTALPAPAVTYSVLVQPDPVAIPTALPTPFTAFADITPAPVEIPTVLPAPALTFGVVVNIPPLAIPTVLPAIELEGLDACGHRICRLEDRIEELKRV